MVVQLEGDFREEELKEGLYNVAEQLGFDIIEVKNGQRPETDLIRLRGSHAKYKLLKTFFECKTKIEE